MGLPRFDSLKRRDLLVGEPFEHRMTPSCLAHDMNSERARWSAAAVADHARVGLANAGRGDQVGDGGNALHGLDTSHIVMSDASPHYHNLCGAAVITVCDNREMANDDKNGGPNHLKAWREFRDMSQQQLADAVGTTQHQVAYLESGERGLSAKWLRKLAGALDTTVGMILDHDPRELDSDIVEIWATASNRQKKQISEIARTILKTGTDGD